jgi:gas vesicle protein
MMTENWRGADGAFGSINAFACGLLCGAAVGAALALLYAPKPGAETRRQMSESARRLKRRASVAYDDASHAVSDVMARSRRALEVGREAFLSARPAYRMTTPTSAPKS